MNNIKQIALGIGDIFITRLIFDSYPEEINHDLEINLQLVKDYRGNSELYKKFILELMQYLFKDTKLHVINRNCESKTVTKKIYNYFAVYPFIKEKTNLKKYFDLTPILSEKYIIFHTKSRIDGKSNDDYNNLLSDIKQYFKDYKTDYTIVVMGERKMSINTETSMHNIISIYELLLELKSCNKVLDLTHEELYNTPNMENLLKDIRYIGNAEMNFGLGWGGNFGLSWATTDKFCFYIDNLNHKILDFFINEKVGYLYREIESFKNKLDEFKSTRNDKSVI